MDAIVQALLSEVLHKCLLSRLPAFVEETLGTTFFYEVQGPRFFGTSDDSLVYTGEVTLHGAVVEGVPNYFLQQMVLNGKRHVRTDFMYAGLRDEHESPVIEDAYMHWNEDGSGWIALEWIWNPMGTVYVDGLPVAIV